MPHSGYSWIGVIQLSLMKKSSMTVSHVNHHVSNTSYSKYHTFCAKEDSLIGNGEAANKKSSDNIVNLAQ